MEQARTDYRAALLWMANISKELDPEEYKRLDKFREVSYRIPLLQIIFQLLSFLLHVSPYMYHCTLSFLPAVFC